MADTTVRELQQKLQNKFQETEGKISDLQKRLTALQAQRSDILSTLRTIEQLGFSSSTGERHSLQIDKPVQNAAPGNKSKRVRSSKLVQEVLAASDQPLSREQVVNSLVSLEQAKAWKKPRNAAFTAFARAVERGLIVELSDGLYASASKAETGTTERDDHE
ncbi:MAG: hypothetical protein ABF811_00780 [Pseudoclavibacter sp.]